MVDDAKIQETVKALTDAQRRALKHRQTAVFMPDAVFARSATTAALRRRGLIAGAMPHAELTELGEAVCKALDA